MSNENQFTHKSKPTRVINKPFVYLNSAAITLSLFAMICLPLFAFAYWAHPPGEIHPDVILEFKLHFGSSSWTSLALLFLFLTFLLCLIISIILLLHSIGILFLRFPPKKNSLLGFIPSYTALTITVTFTIVFAQYSVIVPWHLSFCFYSSLICSILLMILFLLQMTKKPLFRTSAYIPRIVY